MADIYAFEPLFGHWRIEELIGEGSFGKVYRASRTEFGTTYYSAIKHIPIPKSAESASELRAEGLFTGEESERRYYEQMVCSLTEEIQTSYRLRGNTTLVSCEDHVVIPRAGGLGCDIFIRMELLTDLSDYMSARAVTELDVIELGKDVCLALEVLEGEKLLHRDIKPANIFVNAQGRFKLGDFGVARSLESVSGDMSIKGTFNYMAPEIYRGGAVDHTADIYSLGLVLYRLLNGGRAPFLSPPPTVTSHEDANAALSRRMNGEPLPPPAFCSPKLSRCILRACAFDPRERYRSAREFFRALDGVDNDETVAITRPRREPPGEGWPPPGGGPVFGAGRDTVYDPAWGQGHGTSMERTTGPERGAVRQQPYVTKRTSDTKLWLIIAAVALLVVLAVLLVVLLITGGGDEDEPAPTAAPTVSADEAAGADIAVPSQSVEALVTQRPTPAPTPKPMLIYEQWLDDKIDQAAPNSNAGAFIWDVTRETEYASELGYSQLTSSALINIATLFTIAEGIDRGDFDLSTEILFKVTASGRGYIDASRDGSYLSLDVLLRAMLGYSDNNAANSLLSFLGFGRINRCCESYGFDSVEAVALIGATSAGWENRVSPRDAAMMLAALWNNELGLGRQYLQSNFKILDSTTESGLSALSFGGSDVYNHNGVRTFLYNEAAIISNERETYIVAFLGEGDGMDQLAELAEDIGRYADTCLN